MKFPEQVKIVEVGPRDGLQNEAKQVPVETRVELIERLAAAGLPVVEVGSFVSPKWVPQMAGSDQVYQRLKKAQGVSYPMLVPNMKGLEGALTAGVKEIALFSAVSESFTKKNINSTIDESLERYGSVMETALQEGLKVRGYVSCVLGCPYEGEVAPAVVAQVASRLHQMGCYEISLGDTIGTGTPVKTEAMIRRVTEVVPVEQLAVHFHDTYGQGLANILVALQLGVTTIDSAVAGLGGCPYAKGASGNVATEDVLYMLNGMGITTGVDMNRLLKAGRFICDYLESPTNSRVAKALL
ncbi:MAG: hydroxymethylglutaryl-CoA lyase [Sedimenticola sp.]